MRFFKNLYFRFFREKTEFNQYLVEILGYYPENLYFYELAFQHKSVHKISNERLEFLGDSILDAVISKSLYFRFPNKNEGELSKLRSKIVNRTFLNIIGKEIGLHEYLKYHLNTIPIEETNMIGNAFESLIGAIYLDGGYAAAEQFLENQVFEKYVNWDEMDSKTIDFKSKLTHFAQKSGKTLQYLLLKEELHADNKKYFEVSLELDATSISIGTGSNKKKAEQDAAEKALEKLED